MAHHALSVDSPYRLVSYTRGMCKPGKRVILGISGPGGSGKSTLAQLLVDTLNKRTPGIAALVAQDGFHLPNAILTARDQMGVKGAPYTFDVDAFKALLQRLRANPNTDILAPKYSRVLHEPEPDKLLVKAGTPLVIVEGNYLLLDRGGWEGVRPLLDVAWFLSVEWDTLRSRLIARQVKGGRRNQEEAERFVDSSDLPNAELINETAGRADLVINPSEGAFTVTDMPEFRP